MELTAEWKEINELIRATDKMARLHGEKQRQVREINIKACLLYTSPSPRDS